MSLQSILIAKMLRIQAPWHIAQNQYDHGICLSFMQSLTILEIVCHVHSTRTFWLRVDDGTFQCLCYHRLDSQLKGRRDVPLVHKLSNVARLLDVDLMV